MLGGRSLLFVVADSFHSHVLATPASPLISSSAPCSPTGRLVVLGSQKACSLLGSYLVAAFSSHHPLTPFARVCAHRRHPERGRPAVVAHRPSARREYALRQVSNRNTPGETFFGTDCCGLPFLFVRSKLVEECGQTPVNDGRFAPRLKSKDGVLGFVGRRLLLRVLYVPCLTQRARAHEKCWMDIPMRAYRVFRQS